MQKYFWNLFEHTGSIDAYLAYKDMQAYSQTDRKGDEHEQAESQGHCY